MDLHLGDNATKGQYLLLFLKLKFHLSETYFLLIDIWGSITLYTSSGASPISMCS